MPVLKLLKIVVFIVHDHGHHVDHLDCDVIIYILGNVWATPMSLDQSLADPALFSSAKPTIHISLLK